MKVLCINGVNAGDLSYYSIPANKEDEVFEGEPYTVIKINNECGIETYTLLERPATTTYAARRFIFLWNAKEKEAERNYKHQPA